MKVDEFSDFRNPGSTFFHFKLWKLLPWIFFRKRVAEMRANEEERATSYVAYARQHWNEYDTRTRDKFLKIHTTHLSDTFGHDTALW